MGHNVTLGGDRLGSGKKNKVHLHGFERSTHDLGYLWRSSMASGTLVPFLCEVALPGDTFDIDLDAVCMTHPTIGPLFGSYKIQLDVFQCPIRLYQGLLHNNKLGIGLNMSSIKLPQMELQSSTLQNPTANFDFDNQQINPSCILSYLGIRGISKLTGSGSTNKRKFNAIPLLSVWDIYKNYYANKQEGIGAVIHTPLAAATFTVSAITINGAAVTQTTGGTARVAAPGATFDITYGSGPVDLNKIIFTTAGVGTLTAAQLATFIVDTGTHIIFQMTGAYGTITVNNWDLKTNEAVASPPQVSTFDLTKLDDMREYLLANLSTTPIIINAASLEPYKWVTDFTSTLSPYIQTQEGLPVKTYQSDLFNNWMSTEWIDGPGGINDITAIDTSGGSFNIDTLVLSKKVYEMLNRIAISGGTYNDWIDANWDHTPFMRAETPMYMGGLSKELVFQQVVSNSASNADTVQPLGTLAGRGHMGQKHKGGQVRIKIDEPSYIIGLVSLTPRVDYSQGNKWDTTLQTMDDLHKPGLDAIGFQELITEQMAWWSTEQDLATGDLTLKSAGKQPAWINYMTNVNQTRGNFAQIYNEMFMTLNRRYEYDSTTLIKDLTTYIDPTKFNFIFAETAIDAQNFWMQIAVDITARRKMSAKVMPNL